MRPNTGGIRELRETSDLETVALLFSRLWHEPGAAPPVSAHLLKALVLTGNYVAGDFDASGSLVGASVAFAAVGPGAEMHSHITGVLASEQGRGRGRALKMHQRAWALERGIRAITWTFDPLVRRNAVFNLDRLGARAVRYLENVYGEMDDELNAGDESDRLWVRWDLEAPMQGPTSPEEGAHGMIVEIPDDIEALRRSDPAAARAWRRRIRDELGASMASGAAIIGVTPDGNYRVAAPAEKGVS